MVIYAYSGCYEMFTPLSLSVASIGKIIDE
jgi:hypothetical protein